MHRSLLTILTLIAVLSAEPLTAAESIWLEAEHLDGIQGFCWPLGKPAMKKTDGHWALSGPGWAAEWNQGGESGFLSIATGADDDRATSTKQVEIPTDGNWFVWVRYGDWREKTERFQIRIEQQGSVAWTGRYGETPVIEEDNEMKLYFGWAFGWDQRQVSLKKGSAKLSLLSTTKDPEPRQIDIIVLTTDASYRPRIKERPKNPAWNLLEGYRQGAVADLEPLTRRRPEFKLPEAWKLKTFKDRGFLYLWNMTSGTPTNWLSDDPQKVLYPYTISDADVRTEFEKKYAGQKDVPIFSDPRIVPTFHGVGGGVFFTDPKTGAVDEGGVRFAKWLDDHPKQQWAMMTNYHPGKPIGEEGQKLFTKYRDRFVGEICGEALSSTYPSVDALKAATEQAKTRRQLAETFSPVLLKTVAERYNKIYGRDFDQNAYADTISCLSVGNIVFAPLALDWGARTVGYESSTASSSILGMRWAFIRGAARQHNSLSATYRSCNFGDSATIFSITQSYTSPRNFLDNYYSVYSGAGMTWYKMDIWYQYMAGSSMFYHEQGHDEFWKPGGLTAAGIKDVQLSPKGQLVDRFLRVTAQHPDRGHPYTPAAILVDYAHGWEPSPYWPNSFKNFHQHPDRFRYGDHEKMLEEYLWTAYYPIGPESEKPMTGTNEVYLPSAFGDMFDVIFAYPDVKKWRTIDTYPLVVAAGEIELTVAEGRRLNDYVQQGGTLVVADAHLTGPGAALLNLPTSGPVSEANTYHWLADKTEHPSPRFRYRPIPLGKEGRALATTPTGETFCAAFDRGQGRLIYLSVPHGLAVGKQAVPVVARLMAHLSRGLMPIEVRGDVERLVNRNQSGWVVTLMNPAGQAKPQQGITPTDYRENRTVTLRCAVPVSSATDWLFPDERLSIKPVDNHWDLEVTVPAGGVRIIELRD
jgi:hypothetical protein